MDPIIDVTQGTIRMIPLAEEVGCELAHIGIPAEGLLIPQHWDVLYDRVSKCCTRFRPRLVQEEAATGPRPILGVSFWDITGKYRCDALEEDVVYLADHFAWAIGLASVYLKLAPDRETFYRQDAAKNLCMYHLEFAMRLASSGWDRIALLLDLALDLKTEKECNLPLVLREIPKKYPPLVNDEHFKWLKQFRDQDFPELEAGKGGGLRHEVTHLLTLRTRRFCESLECYDVQAGEIVPTPKSRLEEVRDRLLQHYRYYTSGITEATDLICAVFP